MRTTPEGRPFGVQGSSTQKQRRFFAGGVDAGSRINMEQDFVALRDLANVLPLHRDQSHGWTCNHAINRLIDYQRFLYERVDRP